VKAGVNHGSGNVIRIWSKAIHDAKSDVLSKNGSGMLERHEPRVLRADAARISHYQRNVNGLIRFEPKVAHGEIKVADTSFANSTGHII